MEEVKLSLFTDDMILYTENPKDATKTLLELINEFSNIVGYNLIYRNLLCFSRLTINYQKEKLRKQSHLRLHQKNKILIPRNKSMQRGLALGNL